MFMNNDYGSARAGSLVRRTHTDYVSSTITRMRLPVRTCAACRRNTSVYDGHDIEKARTTFEYDNYTAAPPNHAGLTDRPNIINLDAAFTTSYLTRGNVTASTNYLLTNGTITGSVTSYAHYDVAGNVVKAIDARGYATLLDYSDRFWLTRW
jgi:hypothetical protein